MVKLFEPISIRDVTARNRIVVSPMCQYRSVEGAPTDWHLVHMGRYAVGGVGIVFNEETAVEKRGRKTHRCAGLYRDDQVPEFGRLTSLVKDLGAVPAIQLGHSGRRASESEPMQGRVPLTGDEPGREPWQPISASAVAAGAGTPVPRAMDMEDIAVVVAAFAEAARRSLEAGFEILEIHGAHGYLIQQFLSPLSNRRTDRYGGSLVNRMRFALDVTEAVRAVWPDTKPLFFRISSVDGKGGIWSLDDSVVLTGELKALGVDVIVCSSGGITGDSPMPPVPRVPAYHVPYARRIKTETGILTMAPGLITTAEQAERLLDDGDVDMICMARELMYDSDWPAHAARLLGVPDHFELFPPDFAFRLKAREEQRKTAINPAHPV